MNELLQPVMSGGIVDLEVGTAEVFACECKRRRLAQSGGLPGLF